MQSSLNTHATMGFRIWNLRAPDHQMIELPLKDMSPGVILLVTETSQQDVYIGVGHGRKNRTCPIGGRYLEYNPGDLSLSQVTATN